MKYTIDTENKTIQLHEAVDIHKIVSILTEIKNGMSYKLLGPEQSPPLPVSTPWYPPIQYGSTTGDRTVTCAGGACCDDSLLKEEADQMIGNIISKSNGNIKTFNFPGGFGIAISNEEEGE